MNMAPNDSDPVLPEIEQLLEPTGRYDLWHTHVDWKGEGNRSPEARQVFLRALFQLFERTETFVGGWNRPAQVWLVIHKGDSGQDAVFVHTPNAHRNNFPYLFDGVSWKVDLPAWLREFVDPQRHEAGRLDYEGAVSYWVRPRNAAVAGR